jgi:hypothetical protein
VGRGEGDGEVRVSGCRRERRRSVDQIEEGVVLIRCTPGGVIWGPHIHLSYDRSCDRGFVIDFEVVVYLDFIMFIIQLTKMGENLKKIICFVFSIGVIYYEIKVC